MKSADRYSQSNGHVASGAGEPVPDQEAEYVQHDSAGYNRGSYTYTTNASVGSLTAEHSQLTSDMTGSPTQQNGSGRMTPRTSGGPPPQWASGYTTSPRPAPASTSLYSIVSDTRGTSANGTATENNYSVTSSSAPTYSTMNGSLGSAKRGREDDEVDRIGRPDSRGTEYDTKRRRTITEATVGAPVGVTLGLQPMKAGGGMARRR